MAGPFSLLRILFCRASAFLNFPRVIAKARAGRRQMKPLAPALRDRALPLSQGARPAIKASPDPALNLTAFRFEAIPQISIVSLVSTFTACATHRGILGPGVSGGYYSVGLKEGRSLAGAGQPMEYRTDPAENVEYSKNPIFKLDYAERFFRCRYPEALSGSGVRNHSNIWE